MTAYGKTTSHKIVFEAEPLYLQLCNTEFTTDEDTFDQAAIEFVAATVEGFTRDDNEEYSQTVTAVEGDNEAGVQPGDVMVCSGIGCNVYFVRQITTTAKEFKIAVHVKNFDEQNDRVINPSSVGSAYGHYEGVQWTYAADAPGYGVFHLLVEADAVEFIEEELAKDDRVTWYSTTEA